MRYSSALAAAVLCATVLATYSSSAAPVRRTIAASSTDTVHRELRRGGRAFSGEEPKDCVRSPARLPPSIAPEGGATVTVRVGAVVYVELVEAEEYLSGLAGAKPPPRVFPWAAARSSDPRVLERVALCRSREVSTLPLVVYAFRALRPGATTLTAPIARAWERAEPARRRGLRPYRATVLVRASPRYEARVATRGLANGRPLPTSTSWRSRRQHSISAPFSSCSEARSRGAHLDFDREPA
jgi:hypothetical protein